MSGLKHYTRMTEIEAEPKYRPNNPVSLISYKALTGWYKFPEGQEVECCFQKPNENLCRTKHLRGWVAEIADGSLTIIGGDCGTDKFGADSAFGRDIRQAQRALDEGGKLARLAELLAKRDQALEELFAMKSQLVELRKAVANHRERIGRVAWNVLLHMSRTGKSAIEVLGITPEVRDEDGEVVKDRRSMAIHIASFSGTAVCDETRVIASLDGIRRIEAAYKRAGVEPSLTLKAKEVRELNAALADQQREVTRARELVEQLSRFEANDFTALAFAVTDIGERIRLMQYGLERQAGLSSKNAAKKLLLDREAALKLRYGVRNIRVQ